MVELLSSLVDRIIQLLQFQGQERRRLVETFASPIFKDMELIAADYMGILAELVVKLEAGEDLPDVLAWLEIRRSKLISIRAKIRATLFNACPGSSFMETRLASHIPDPLLKNFVEGTLGVIAGGLSLTENGHIRIEAYPYTKLDPFNATGHTLIDIFEHSISSTQKINHRGLLIRNVKTQQSAVAEAWGKLSDAYYKMLSITHK